MGKGKGLVRAQRRHLVVFQKFICAGGVVASCPDTGKILLQRGIVDVLEVWGRTTEGDARELFHDVIAGVGQTLETLTNP